MIESQFTLIVGVALAAIVAAVWKHVEAKPFQVYTAYRGVVRRRRYSFQKALRLSAIISIFLAASGPMLPATRVTTRNSAAIAVLVDVTPSMQQYRTQVAEALSHAIRLLGSSYRLAIVAYGWNCTVIQMPTWNMLVARRTLRAVESALQPGPARLGYAVNYSLSLLEKYEMQKIIVAFTDGQTVDKPPAGLKAMVIAVVVGKPEPPLTKICVGSGGYVQPAENITDATIKVFKDITMVTSSTVKIKAGGETYTPVWKPAAIVALVLVLAEWITQRLIFSVSEVQLRWRRQD